MYNIQRTRATDRIGSELDVCCLQCAATYHRVPGLGLWGALSLREESTVRVVSCMLLE
jgi:hypothetical protein